MDGFIKIDFEEFNTVGFRTFITFQHYGYVLNFRNIFSKFNLILYI